MKPLDEVYEVLHQVLLETNRQWEAMRHDMNEFISIVSKLPAEMVKLRLTAMTFHILTRARSLRKQHNDRGYVFIMMSNIIIGIYWAENEYSAEDKEHFRRRGYLIISPEAMGTVIERFIDQVDSGQLAEAVDWVNRYEPFLRKD